MSSVRAGLKEGAARSVDSAQNGVASGRVLPRYLRRPLRFVLALSSGRVHVPAHVGSLATALFLGATGLYGMQVGGHSMAVSEVLASSVGFALEDIHITGNTATSDLDVLGQLGLNGATSVISINAEEARRKLIELPWVVDAQVTKIYPKALAVKLVERVPVAIWQHGEDLSLIDARGNVIAPLTGNRFAHLPLYVGFGADRHADELEARLIFHPTIRERVKAAIRVADRRWDLRLDNGVTISLPAENVAAAFERFNKFDAGRDVLSRDIALVDLRLEDRITLRLSEESHARREKAIKERAKAIKAARRKT